jgi:hypothetical protein
MTPAELERLALSLPEAHAAPHFERTSFRVGTKIFATMTEAGDEAMVRVAPRDKVEELLFNQPAVFFSYGKWTLSMGAVGVRLAKVERRQMEALVVDSWKRIAPKRTVAAFEAEHGAVERARKTATKRAGATKPAKRGAAKKRSSAKPARAKKRTR